MKIPFTKSNGGAQSPASLFAALVLAAIVPAGCVIWFMTVAMRNERLAVQEQLADVYLKHLSSAQRQVAAFWTGRLAELQTITADSAAEKFAAIVRANLADSIVVHDATGKVSYPAPASVPPPDGNQTAWLAANELEFQKKDFARAAVAYGRIAESSGNLHTKARALLAEAGALLRADKRSAALVRLGKVAGDTSLRHAVSPQGTLLAPNAQLWLVKLLGDGGHAGSTLSSAVLQPALESNPARAEAPRYVQADLQARMLDGLIARLNDYADTAMPAAQRRFLMHEVTAFESPAPRQAPGPELVERASGLLQVASFPTLAAEDLAADYLESNPPPPAATKLERAPLPNVWRLATSDRRVVALFRGERIKAEMATVLDAIALPGASVRLLAPDEAFASSKFVPPREAGEFLPGWRLALAFNGDDPFVEASQRQSRLYLWTGSGVVIVIALLAWLVARYVSAQMRLARLKNELVSTVSHELKTPLASMRALVDTLRNDRCSDEQQKREYLELIAKENVRLSHLIENFLTFSRLERGKQPFCFEPVAPAAIVSAAAEALREKLETEHCWFSARIAPDLPMIRGDADALTTVLVNLLDNACKYTGGEKRIAVRASADDGAVCFEVTDNGVGLAPDETKRIFDRFYQVDQSLTRQRGGCGLGLSIVQSIIRAHGGTVEVESALGKGSTFRVKIPASEPPIQSMATEGTEAAQRAQGKPMLRNSVTSVSPP